DRPRAGLSRSAGAAARGAEPARGSRAPRSAHRQPVGHAASTGVGRRDARYGACATSGLAPAKPALGDVARKPPELSVVVVGYRMERELPRTLRSLSPSMQRGIKPDQYEIILIDNGSPGAMPLASFPTYGAQVL